MKQTAVEFLYKSLEGIRMDYNQKKISAEQAINSRAEILESAKEIEKQHIIDAWNDVKICDSGYKDAEQYYNETFNK